MILNKKKTRVMLIPQMDISGAKMVEREIQSRKKQTERSASMNENNQQRKSEAYRLGSESCECGLNIYTYICGSFLYLPNGRGARLATLSSSCTPVFPCCVSGTYPCPTVRTQQYSYAETFRRRLCLILGSVLDTTYSLQFRFAFSAISCKFSSSRGLVKVDF